MDASGLKRSVGVSEPFGESPSLIELLKKFSKFQKFLGKNFKILFTWYYFRFGHLTRCHFYRRWFLGLPLWYPSRLDIELVGPFYVFLLLLALLAHFWYVSLWNVLSECSVLQWLAGWISEFSVRQSVSTLSSLKRPKWYECRERELAWPAANSGLSPFSSLS